MIDKHGYRPNVGIIIANKQGQVFWGKRARQDAWHSLRAVSRAASSRKRRCSASYGRRRPSEKGCRIVAVTKDWLRYRLPAHFKRDKQSRFVGQKQKYFLVRLVSDDQASSSTVNKSQSSMIGVGSATGTPSVKSLNLRKASINVR